MGTTPKQKVKPKPRNQMGAQKRTKSELGPEERQKKQPETFPKNAGKGSRTRPTTQLGEAGPPGKKAREKAKKRKTLSQKEKEPKADKQQ